MFDQSTAALIREAPQLEGLDRERLPELLTEAFAEIAAARIRLRESRIERSEEMAPLVESIRRLAFTNEALVSTLPDREDRRAAAFVSATAHQLCFNADRLLREEAMSTFAGPYSISSDIAAILLFLVAEATSDARDVAKAMRLPAGESIDAILVRSIHDLAVGRLVSLSDRSIPDLELSSSGDAGGVAVAALYREILGGVQALASQLIDGRFALIDQGPAGVFQRVCDLSVGRPELLAKGWSEMTASSFSGPRHFAALLVAISRDLPGSAITNTPSPSGLDPDKWSLSMRRMAKSRPFLWRNHRDAISRGYLELGTSAVVGFPTGAGKSMLAELKINSVLLADKKVIFLAPTHALVDQTATALKRSFPSASVQRERQDELGINADEEMPEILIMTPEACLTQISIDVSVFDDVGLFVFDECHLLHPSESLDDRRAIDAMLCILNISSIASDIDFLLLSAMMKNTEDMAGWIEELTGRPCLSLALSWKPTRQLRGAVVYQQSTITSLQNRLARSKRRAETKGPPVSLRRSLDAQPLALFSVKQTWATNDRNDYALVTLLEEPIRLAASKYWKVTPNAVSVSSAIAVASAEAGVKTLVFFQTIRNAASAARTIGSQLPSASIELNKEEERWLAIATIELGDSAHLYIDAHDGSISRQSTVHHGLLLPEERHLCESLYKRPDGIKVLTATSTLAQGMNLPSELVVIGEDSRFDAATDRREILQAQELLNAAGRAGRAGENPSGVVLVVPGKVVGIDLEEATIGAHWTNLRKIFGQSDQCLEIDDPLTAILDRVHVSTGDTREIERYAIVRLASSDTSEATPQALSNVIRRSFGAYMARKKHSEDWLNERVETAKKFFAAQAPQTESEIVQTQIAASLGLSVVLVSRLSAAIAEYGPDARASVPAWRRWLIKWLTKNPDLLEKTFRRQSLIDLFGEKAYGGLKTDGDRAAFAIPRLRRLIWLWMRGVPYSEMELALGTDPAKLKTCDGARKFVLRVVPEFSYLFGLPVLLYERAHVSESDPEPPEPVVAQLRQCARLGLNSLEKVAFSYITRGERFSRRQVHRQFSLIRPYLSKAPPNESWEQLMFRVRSGVAGEQIDRTLGSDPGAT